MKTFLGMLVAWFAFCLITAQIVFGFLAGNFWAIIAAVAVVLAILSAIIAKLFSRIEELEKKIELLHTEQDTPPEE